MTLAERIKAFSELRHILDDSISDNPVSASSKELSALINKQHINNKWFTTANVNMAIGSISQMLHKEKLETWLKAYNLDTNPAKAKTIAVIMAGNIPLVGFHDFLSVLITGNKILAKTSSKDSELIMAIASLLYMIEPGFKKMIEFTNSNISAYDAVIATGSNNTARYFEYYFAHKPHIFRKNRNSVAIIRKETSANDLKNLGTDIFSYFGLGCRNVSKIFLEEGIDPDHICKNWNNWKDIIRHQAYANNYLYNKSILHVNKEKYKDLNYALLKEDQGIGIASPVSVILYEYYKDRHQLSSYLKSQEDKIQCVVSETDINFGDTQFPQASEYADNIDTVEFLNSL